MSIIVLDELMQALGDLHSVHDLEDAVYDVRENIDWELEPFDGSSWDHPRVKKYSRAVETILQALEEWEETFQKGSK